MMSRPSALITAFSMSSLLSAQFDPEHRFVYPPSGVALAVHDMDGDGDGDIVRASGDRLLLHEQTAPLEFNVTATFGSCGPLQRMRFGDLDGNGVNDLVFADPGIGRIAWVSILGGGSYGPLADLLTGLNEARDAWPTDVDGDGDLDLVHSLGNMSITLAWSENLGGASFGPPTTIWAGSIGVWDSEFLEHFKVSDVDSDGDPDIVMLRPTLRWYENDGSGGFSVNAILGGGGAYDYAVADIDGDLDDDIVITTQVGMTGQLDKLLNNGSGGFGPPQTAMTPGAPYTYMLDLEVGDRESDGDLDIFWQLSGGIGIPHELGGTVNDGSGGFSGAGGGYGSDDFKHYAVGDLDGDLLIDKVSYTNGGTWAFASTVAEYVWLTSNRPPSIDPVDLNSDGLTDALLSGYASSGPLMEGGSAMGWTTHLNMGAGEMAQHPEATGTTALYTVSGDLDGDGDKDAVGIWTDPWIGTAKQFYTLMNTGGGVLDSTEAIGSWFYPMIPTHPSLPLLRDLDMDGDLDVFKYVWATHDTYLNDGSGSFGPVNSYASGGMVVPWTATLADVDADGDPDFVHPRADSLFWMANNGAGVPGPAQFAGFSPVDPIANEYGVHGQVMRAIDLEFDGWEDLVLHTGDTLAIVQNDSGTFVPGPVLTAMGTWAYDAGDMDNDGWVDLVAQTLDGNVLFWHALGGGAFAAALLVASAPDNSGTNDIRFADMDGDGDLDLLTCSTMGSAAWMGNNGLSVTIQAALPAASQLHVYPNPWSDHFVVQCGEILDELVLVELRDATGRLVSCIPGTGLRELRVERGNLLPGLYTVHIQRGARRLAAARVVVQ